MPTRIRTGSAALLGLLLALGTFQISSAKKKEIVESADPYAGLVWPAPPAPPRIKLDRVIRGRPDVEAKSGFRRKLMAGSPQSIYDEFKKPHAVAFDPQGRILVTDTGLGALLRFDREARAMDVLGTRNTMPFKLPLGLDVGPDGTIYVADGGHRRVLALSADGDLLRVYGANDTLDNPTDAAISQDGKRLYVTDAKGQRVVIFNAADATPVKSFGGIGHEAGQFNFPTALGFGPEGQLFVVDQLNCRVEMFDPDGEYVDEFGFMGQVGGSFARPKDLAIDEVGLIYVVDNAFNNVQLFDLDFTFLTFVGQGGGEAGQFFGASGVAVRGDEFAVVDQLGKRLQVFRFIVPKDE